MAKFVTALGLLLFEVSVVFCADADGPGLPLFLTPYIDSGKIEKARNLSRVESLTEDLVSYSGYFTINKQYKSNSFFWFFPCETDWKTKPVLLWLQGGPGSSSLVGLFLENGPLRVTESGDLKQNEYSWTKTHNVMYLDNPVGTGFSFTNSKEGYADNQFDVGNDVYNALIQFFKLFPELIDNPFYLTGESYAGKYIPSSAYIIHLSNPLSPLKINLQGLFIGNGMIDPVNMLVYGDYLYQLGLIDNNGRDEFHKRESAIKHEIHHGNWVNATKLFGRLILGYFYSNTTIFNDLTGLQQHYNFLNNTKTDVNLTLVTSDKFRHTIHAGNTTFSDGQTVADMLFKDVTKSVKPVIEMLLENYRILFYNGQLDIICAYPLTENVLKQLKWSGADKFRKAERKIWKSGSEIAGYYKTSGKLTEVMVRNAGHLVPADQPKWALELINKFTSKEPF